MRIPQKPPSMQEIISDAQKVKHLPGVFNDPRYQDVIRRIEAEYEHWDKARFKAQEAGLPPDLVWFMIKASRRSTMRPLPLLGAPGKPLWFNMPDVLQEELMLVDQQLAGRLLSSEEQPLNPSDRERFIISALREEAIASSMLEGAATTRQDAKKMLASGRKPRTTGERMVLNTYRAISFIREQRNTPVTPEFLLEVQRILTEGTLEKPDEVGRFRRDEDTIHVTDPYNQVLHTPPPASELKARLRDLCNFANGKGRGFIHPVVRASVIHFQIGFDHPFCDGNGRTARAMFYWSMLNAGYWLFEYLPISRLIYAGPAKYGRAYLYTETDDFDVTYFLAYKARIIRRARQESSEYIARKQREMTDARKVFESDRRLNHRQRDVIVRMIRSPDHAISIQEHQARHNIAYGTARSDLLALEAWKYLSKTQSGNRFDFIQGPKLKSLEV